MNSTVEFSTILINQREKIVDYLYSNYSYSHLHDIFDVLSSDMTQNFKIEPNNKHLYRILTGKYQSSKYDKSSIQWLPSSELVDSLISLATNFGINTIEEINTDLGIVSALMKKICSQKNLKMNITTADSHLNGETCDKLNIIDIAKRKISDYQFYKEIGEQIPEMIINSYYPSDSNSKFNDNYILEINDLLSNANHSIIVLLLPVSYCDLYELFFNNNIAGDYRIDSFYVKALSKHYFLHNLMKNHYPTGMMMHVIVKRTLFKDDVNESEYISRLVSSAIIPNREIDKYCSILSNLCAQYERISHELLTDIVHEINFKKSCILQPKINYLIESCSFLNTGVNVPEYLFKIDEYIFWIRCVKSDLYLIFNSRQEFYEFYLNATKIKISEFKRNLENYPSWVNNIHLTYSYIYLKTILKTNDHWVNDKKKFYKEFNVINEKNKKLIWSSSSKS